MKYNIAQNSFISSNTVSGNVDLSLNDLLSIIRDEVDATVVLSGSQTLCLDLELGGRIKIDSAKYYFSSSDPLSTLASGVSFYYKDDATDPYFPLTTQVDLDNFFAVISGTSAPNYIRIVHSLATGSGIVEGLYVYNNEDVVDFGASAEKTSYITNLSVEDNSIDILEAYVFNSGDEVADARVYIEPTRTFIDDCFSISASEDGPWTGVISNDTRVCGVNDWNNGTLSNLYVHSLGDIRLKPGTNASGTYTTKIFELSSHQKLNHLYSIYEYPTPTGILIFSDDFSSGLGTNWTTYAGTTTYNLGYASNTGNDCDVRLNRDLSFGHDWFFSIDYKNQFWNNSYQPGAAIILFEGYTGRVYISINKTTTVATLYINEINRGSFTLSPSGSTNWQEQWARLVFKREFNTLKFKMWRRDLDAEPAWQLTINNIAYTDISEIGGIRVFDEYGWVHFDNVTVSGNLFSDGTQGMLSVNPSDTTETIELRSSNFKPKDLDLYITAPNNTALNFYHLENEVLQETRTYSVTSMLNYYLVGDSYTGDVYGVIKGINNYYDDFIYLSVSRTTGVSYALTIFTGSNNAFSVQNLKPESEGGLWFSIYFTGSSLFGFYHYSCLTGLTQTYARTSSSKFLTDFDVDYTTGHCWIIDLTADMLLKLDKDGNTLYGYYFLSDARKVVSDPRDGGCWLLTNNGFEKLNSQAESEYTISYDTTYVQSFDLDLHGDEDAFWVLQDTTVKRVLAEDGRESFSIDIVDPVLIYPLKSGVVVRSMNDSYYYISRAEQRVMNDLSVGTTNYLGFLSFKVSDSVSSYDNRFPTPLDPVWPNLAWKKVSLHDINLPLEKYNQVRITFRAATSMASPRLQYLYFQEAIELTGIYPGNNRKFYIKADVSEQDRNIVGSYDTYLKVWWYMPL